MSKLYTCILTTFLALLFALPLSSQETSESSTTPKAIEYIVTAESANLRADASTTSAIVGKVTKGDSLLIYDETPETSGWLRIHQSGDLDAYIADFLVERAPTRFYSLAQEPIITASGRGKDITEIYDIPQGAYRIDAAIEDNSFILHVISVEGDCRDRSIFNEASFEVRQLMLSGLFVSSGCSVLFETDNVDGNWQFEARDLLDPDFFLDSVVEIENGISIAGQGRSLTMPTQLSTGIWSISGNVKDRAFILHAHVLAGDCDDESVFNELDFDSNELEIKTVYRNSGDDNCIIFWETTNVDGEWSLTFEKILVLPELVETEVAEAQLT